MSKDNSNFGLTSFIMGLVSLTNLFSCFVFSAAVAGFLNINNQEPMYTVVGLLMIIIGFVSIVGLGLGITSLAQKEKRKVFSILGLVTNIPIIMLLIVFWIIGSRS